MDYFDINFLKILKLIYLNIIYFLLFIIMSRAKRTHQFRKTVEREWTLKYWSFIQENPGKPWNWRSISSNPNITWDIIKENPDKPWDYCGLSKNPNITMDIIKDNPGKPWDWERISSNKFQKDKKLFIEEAYKKYLAAYKIQNWWKHITMSPYYKIGRKFINKKYDNLFD